jgi:hypothetical protein
MSIKSSIEKKLLAVSRDYLEMVESIVLRVTPERIISFLLALIPNASGDHN